MFDGTKALCRGISTGLLTVLLGLLSVSSAAGVINGAFSERLQEGSDTLVLSGCGTREIMWTDVYRIALYLPRPSRDAAAILSEITAKTVILYAVYDGNYPDAVPEDWRERLRGEVDREVMRATRNLFSRLEFGDTIDLSYSPARGTVLRYNGRVLMDGEPHDTMVAFLNLWIGPDPVSDNLRRLLLAGVCD